MAYHKGGKKLRFLLSTEESSSGVLGDIEMDPLDETSGSAATVPEEDVPPSKPRPTILLPPQESPSESQSPLLSNCTPTSPPVLQSDEVPTPNSTNLDTTTVDFSESSRNSALSRLFSSNTGRPSSPASFFRSKSGSNPWLKLRAATYVIGKLYGRCYQSAATLVLGATSAAQEKKRLETQRRESFLKKFSTRKDDNDKKDTNTSLKQRISNMFLLKPGENGLFYWLAVVTVAVLYNLWSCIAREAFTEIGAYPYAILWFSLDALADVIYLLDVVFQFRTGYLEQGLVVSESRKLYKHYTRSREFYLDLACLLPLDLIQIVIGVHPMLRFPRFLKVYRAVRFSHMVESRTAWPNLIRVLNLTHILFLSSHWFAAFYYLISQAQGFGNKKLAGGNDPWSYPKPEGEYASVTRKYLRSLYWSTLTLTTIGDLPPPNSNWEYVFTIISYLIGVFVFATIVGQVGNVITNRNASRLEFERLLDNAKAYLRQNNVPADMQKRVLNWYDYSWSRGRMNGRGDINVSLGALPNKLRTELAIHVNLEILKKVTIFQKCEPEFLHDLVLKMRALIFTPGDYVCRKGEVAREMFIIADGVLEVISDMGEVLSTMSSGDFFGEIGILNLEAETSSTESNDDLATAAVISSPTRKRISAKEILGRRTADVKSMGYSELFVLSRNDVLAALKDHPRAEAVLVSFAKTRLEAVRRSLAVSRLRKSIAYSASDDGNLNAKLANPSSLCSSAGDIPSAINRKQRPRLLSVFTGSKVETKTTTSLNLDPGVGAPQTTPVSPNPPTRSKSVEMEPEPTSEKTDSQYSLAMQTAPFIDTQSPPSDQRRPSSTISDEPDPVAQKSFKTVQFSSEVSSACSTPSRSYESQPTTQSALQQVLSSLRNIERRMEISEAVHNERMAVLRAELAKKDETIAKLLMKVDTKDNETGV